MHLKSTLLATAIAASTTLAATGSASAATGHACKVNGGAAGCPAGLSIAAGSDLIGTDPSALVADDFVFAGAGNTVRCSFATIKGILKDDGGPAFPIGGHGPLGYSPGASFSGPVGANCSAVVGGAGVSATATLIDGNGANPGLVDFQGEWIPGANAPRITLRAPVFVIREFTATAAIANCSYRGGAFIGTVTNNAFGRVNFVAQPVAKLAGPAACPAAATISVPFNVRWAFGGGTGPFRISA